jgi:hypothetical protein
MKTLGWLVVACVLAIQPIEADAAEQQFIRKPGRYSLDDIGSCLVITRQPTGACSLKASWRSGDATWEIDPDRSLVADGWFVFVEKSTRVWVFDGVDGVCLLSHSGKETGVTHYRAANLTSCHRAVWNALPEKLRGKHSRSEGTVAADVATPD